MTQEKAREWKKILHGMLIEFPEELALIEAVMEADPFTPVNVRMYMKPGVWHGVYGSMKENKS